MCTIFSIEKKKKKKTSLFALVNFDLIHIRWRYPYQKNMEMLTSIVQCLLRFLLIGCFNKKEKKLLKGLLKGIKTNF